MELAMNRYYFYNADIYVTDENGDPQFQGSNHGIWVVEDDSTPEKILNSIVQALYDELNAEAERVAREMNREPAPVTASYVVRAFNKVE
jgi:UDP:flavonoid glycosyltransferase YjiC (YdhE family)